MHLKVLVLVCLVSVVVGGEEELMKMMKMMKMMKEMKGGEDKGGMSGENDHDHYEGDGDCKSKEDVMMKKFKEMHEMKEMMAKKEEMKEKMEKFMMFKSFMEKKAMEKKMEEMKKKKHMYEMMHKMEEMKKKKEEADDFEDLLHSFKEKKHEFVMKLTHHFLTLCKCGEVKEQMSKMFMDHNKGNNSQYADEMAEEGAMEAWASGDMAALAMKLKKMSPEQQKKLYMGGLIKSMCGGAKMYVMKAKQFEEQYMMGPSTTADPFTSD